MRVTATEENRFFLSGASGNAMTRQPAGPPFQFLYERRRIARAGDDASSSVSSQSLSFLSFLFSSGTRILPSLFPPSGVPIPIQSNRIPGWPIQSLVWFACVCLCLFVCAFSFCTHMVLCVSFAATAVKVIYVSRLVVCVCACVIGRFPAWCLPCLIAGFDLTG